jgi:CubicO group peptidase (beta-lactamase class C family)
MLKELPENIMDYFENAISQMMTERKEPGAALALIKGNAVIYAKGYAARNLEKNLPVTTDTLAPIGSCSKSYTALAIMQLVQEGKFNLSDPINKYVPFKLGNAQDPITIHHFLTHSSGIPLLGSAEVVIKRGEGTADTYVPLSSWDDFYTFVNGAAQWFVDKPGSRFAYLNEGYTILGKIIEKVSNMKYEMYIEEKIFKPLGMERSTFDEERYWNDPDAATGYIPVFKEDKLEAKPSSQMFSKFANAAGGIMSSLNEQTRYLRAMMNGGIFNGVRILNSNLLDEMFKMHVEAPYLGNMIKIIGKEGYGYAWFITQYFGEKIIFHTGGTGTGIAVLLFVPEKKVGVVAHINTSGGESLALFLVFAGLAILLGKNPMTDFPPLQIMQKYSALTGVYKSYKGIAEATVENRGGLLYFVQKPGVFTPETPFPLIPDDDFLKNNKFYIHTGLGGKIDLEFNVKKRGQVEGLFFQGIYFAKVRNL